MGKKFSMIRNKSISNFSTMKVGGEAKYFKEIVNKKDLVTAVNEAEKLGLPIFVLGGGSNVFFSDGTINYVFVKFKNNSFNYNKIGKSVYVEALAGTSWDKFVEKCVNLGFQGVECLSGIPGTVGAAPVQNIGAYGQELADTFYCLEAYDTKLKQFSTFYKDDCHFAYRFSIFKDAKNKNRYIIYKVKLKLVQSTKPSCQYASLITYLEEKKLKDPTLKETRNAVLAIRNEKLENPDIVPNNGSFFKNPIIKNSEFKKLKKEYHEIPNYPVTEKLVKIPAGWLIEKTGWKGRSLGNAAVSTKHSLILTNPSGKGKAKDIIRLRDRIVADVKEKFGIELEPEVQYIT